MAAEYLETSSRNLSNEVVLVVALTLCQLVHATQHVEESLCCIKVGWFKVGGPCKLGELKRLLVK